MTFVHTHFIYFYDTRNLVAERLKIRGTKRRHVAKCWVLGIRKSIFGGPKFFQPHPFIESAWIFMYSGLAFSVSRIVEFIRDMPNLLISPCFFLKSYVQKEPQLCSGFEKISSSPLLKCHALEGRTCCLKSIPIPVHFLGVPNHINNCTSSNY